MFDGFCAKRITSTIVSSERNSRSRLWTTGIPLAANLKYDRSVSRHWLATPKHRSEGGSHVTRHFPFMRDRSNKMTSSKKQLSPGQREDLLRTLQARFEKNMARYRGFQWARVKARLEAHPEELWSLHEMEKTGGEPDVVGQDKKTGECVFFDCSEQTPSGRVSL